MKMNTNSKSLIRPLVFDETNFHVEPHWIDASQNPKVLAIDEQETHIGRPTLSG